MSGFMAARPCTRSGWIQEDSRNGKEHYRAILGRWMGASRVCSSGVDHLSFLSRIASLKNRLQEAVSLSLFTLTRPRLARRVTKIHQGLLKTLLGKNPKSGAFLDSCLHHCAAWNIIRIDGDLVSTAIQWLGRCLRMGVPGTGLEALTDETFARIWYHDIAIFSSSVYASFAKSGLVNRAQPWTMPKNIDFGMLLTDCHGISCQANHCNQVCTRGRDTVIRIPGGLFQM